MSQNYPHFSLIFTKGDKNNYCLKLFGNKNHSKINNIGKKDKIKQKIRFESNLINSTELSPN